MEAIKLPESNLTAIPGYDLRLREKNADLQVQIRALQIENQRLQIELNREKVENARLLRLAAAAEVVRESRRMDIGDITALVCAYKGIPEEKLKTPSRKPDVVYARKLVWYLCDVYGQDGVIGQGKYFNRDHSTAICGRDDIRDTYPIYEDVKTDVDYLEAQIKSILNG